MRAEHEGYEVRDEHVFRDEGYKPWSPRRPGLAALRALIRARSIEAVITLDSDRWVRGVGLYLSLDEELKRAGIKLIFCRFTRSDGPERKLTKTIMAAEYERAKFLERSWRGKNSRPKDGLIMVGGAIPHGYTYMHADGQDSRGYLKVDPVEAEVVKRIFHIRLQGYGVWRIVKMLFAEGVPTKSGLGQIISPKTRAKGIWSTSTVHRMLRNTTCIGKSYWNKYQFFEPDEAKRRKPANLKRLKTASKANPKDQWVEVAVEPIIALDVFDAVQRLMDNATTTTPRRRIHEYLLLLTIASPA
jgi:site-specific DNA recombinase